MRRPRGAPRPWGFTFACVVILVLAILFGYLGSKANAAPTPPEGWGAAELRIAEEYWGGPPPLCEATVVEWDITLPNGYAGLGTMPSKPTPLCSMEVAPAAFVGGLYYQCVLVIHEYGHWMGEDHSTDASSPMAARLNPSIHIPACERLAGVITHKPTRVRYTISNRHH